MKLSIVVPTLNEGDHILETLFLIRENAFDHVEVLVVDAGSTDDTISLLIESSDERFHLDESLQGKKHESLNTGAHLTSGDIILFLDADTQLPEGFDAMVKHAIANGAVGGAFKMKFDMEPFPLKLIRIFNEVRYRLTKRYFGDQALFCTRDAFVKVGGFPDRIVMESAHMCSSLKKVGKLKLIKEPVITSSRRFLKGGIWRVFRNDAIIYLRYILGLSISEAGTEYWKENAKVSDSQDDKS